jgi:hypothetical protein
MPAKREANALGSHVLVWTNGRTAFTEKCTQNASFVVARSCHQILHQHGQHGGGEIVASKVSTEAKSAPVESVVVAIRARCRPFSELD